MKICSALQWFHSVRLNLVGMIVLLTETEAKSQGKDLDRS